jgi:hypothetical protein
MMEEVKRMKRFLSILLVAVFALSFTAGLVATQTEASDVPECPAYCDDGIWMVCEAVPVGHGGNYRCWCRAVGYCW